jgi:uncharacterized protein (TIGR00255 family)
MPIRSMTGYAQVKGQINDQATFTLSLKSVNHRFLDLHFRMPSESDGLEMKLRRLLKEKLARGHVEITLSVDRNEGDGFRLNRELVSGYIQAFRAASTEFGLMADPDLNVVLRLPGAMGGNNNLNQGELEAAVMAQIEQGLTSLNQMRDEEGRGIDKELRERMANLAQSAARSGTASPHGAANLCRQAGSAHSGIDWRAGGQRAHPAGGALLVDRSDIRKNSYG